MKLLAFLKGAAWGLILASPGLHLPAQTPGLPAFAQSPEPEPSRIALPIRVDLDSVFREAEHAVPITPPGVNIWTVLPDSLDGNTLYRFNLYRDTLSCRLNGGRITVRTKVHYWMEVGLRMAGAWVKGLGSCGTGVEGFREAWLGAESDLAFTPAWGLDLKVEPLEPALVNRCEITFLKVDITASVQEGMKQALVKGAADMEAQVRASALLRDRAAALWSQFQRPIELGQGMYLVAHAERILLAPLRSEGRTLILTPVILARPAVVFGSRPAGDTLPLPSLEPAGAGEPGFHVRLDLDLPFASASAQLAAGVVGKSFDTENGRFEILSARVWGDRGQAFLEVELRGRVEGRVTLVGRPVYNEASNQLVLRDLDYTLESSGWLTRLGSRLFRGSLRQTLSDQANFFLNRSLGDVREGLRQGLNRELAQGLRLSGDVEGFRLSQPRILEDRFQVEAYLDGRVQVDAAAPPSLR